MIYRNFIQFADEPTALVRVKGPSNAKTYARLKFLREVEWEAGSAGEVKCLCFDQILIIFRRDGRTG